MTAVRPRVVLAVLAAVAVSVVVDVVAGVADPGRYAVVGFVGCLGIVAVSKQAGRFLQRPEGSRAGDPPTDALDDAAKGGDGA